jgi:hypothetical protein
MIRWIAIDSALRRFIQNFFARLPCQPGLALLTPRDIVDILKETLPRKPEGKDALVVRIIERHEKRRRSIESRFRAQQRRADRVEQFAGQGV